MKLVCFSNNTGGGLLCDLYNNKIGNLEGYKTNGPEHSTFKLGDTETICTSVDIVKWNSRVSSFYSSPQWFGTHLHTDYIPDPSKFERIVSVTTETRHSKLCRWLRYYYGWFKVNHPDLEESSDLVVIDKVREFAKNVFVPFHKSSIGETVEFEDIVNGRYIAQNNLNMDYFKKWQQGNDFLYNYNNTWAYLRFLEAEYELESGLPFRYF